MEKKEVLNKLNNQYFKSFKRFKDVYEKMSFYDEQVKEFNSGFLKLIGAVLNGNINEIRATLYSSWFFIYATANEKDKLDLELLGIF